jgi:iron complex outermembrane receptor protein
MLAAQFLLSAKSAVHSHRSSAQLWPLAGLLVASVLAPTSSHAEEANPVPAPEAGQIVMPEVVVTPRRRPAAPKRARTASPAPAPTLVVVQPPPRAAPNVIAQPPGQTVTTVTQERIQAAPAATVEDLLQASPGVSFKQGNGPRDLGISIRGSNARNGFGVRNIVMLEDGFPVTQPDGLSRTDLIDPHAYGAVDVYRGPSSAMFGNYATGGAINFRLRPGRDINGVEYGIEGGSFGYLNNYFTFGSKSRSFEGTIFASDVRGNGYIQHSAYDTQTVNSILNFTPTPDDRLTFKVINNTMYADLAIRLSLNQFGANPFQRGCLVAAALPAGCATVNLFANGFSAPTVAQTADQAGLHRGTDRRTIVGARWEHDFDKLTTWRSQLVFDDRNINQPTGSTSAIGDFPSYNFISDVTRRGQLFGFDVVHFAGVNFNTMDSSSDTVNVKPGGNATLGRITANQAGRQSNLGGRVREEISFNDYWTGVAAVGVESTQITGINTLYTYPGGTTSINKIAADREFLNAAPEAALRYRPSQEWQFRGRLATGYGTPSLGNLFVTPAGVPGNNTELMPQTNVGYDVGFDWTPSRDVSVSVTGFYEFFKNELVSQSPGAGLQNFTFNAPRSEHRGIEIAADWRPLPGWRFTAAYTFLDFVYTEYTEQLSAGGLTRRFDRAGNSIPGVAPNELVTRLGYDQPHGPWKGLGGFVDFIWKSSFYMENANLLRAPGYDLVNVNLHYIKEVNYEHVKSATFFFEVKNVFDRTYIASANNITNSINSVTGLQNPGSILATTGTGSIYAGSPRAFIAGMKVAFQ